MPLEGLRELQPKELSKEVEPRKNVLPCISPKWKTL
ncbi:hypothetical protein CPTPhageEI1_223 [Klebsiella phage EI]|nr:hypothetical protein CPTPhageEI1_223 [Klebsiella phage EI]